MSLVSEALRKARRQADAGPGAALPPTLVLPPHRPRPALAIGPLLLVALIAGLAGATGVWWAAGRRHGEPAPRQAAAAASGATAGAPPSPAAPTAAPTPRPAAAGAAPPAPGVGSPAEPGPAPAAQAGTQATAVEASQSPGGHQAAAPSRGSEQRERSFLIDADLGYAKLHLDYLVFRRGSPFGRINGLDVVTGTTVSGFVVEEITADYIKLADKHHTVILRVR